MRKGSWLRLYYEVDCNVSNSSRKLRYYFICMTKQDVCPRRVDVCQPLGPTFYDVCQTSYDVSELFGLVTTLRISARDIGSKPQLVFLRGEKCADHTTVVI